MFGIFRKKTHSLTESGILSGATDIHSHILPCVDDGSPDFSTSSKLLDYLQQLGYQEIWFTPHSMEDLPLNTSEYLHTRMEQFLQQYQGKLKLHLASEHMLDSGFLPRLEKGDVLPLGTHKHLLVETSYYCGPENLRQILRTIFMQGYTPVIAHPERYLYMEWEDYEYLKDCGYELQMNLNSLSGYYGERELDMCLDLLENNMYTYVGTDIHHLGNYSHCLEKIKVEATVLDQVGYLLANNKNL